MTWEEASGACEELGGSLAQFQSLSKWSAVQQSLPRPSPCLLVGRLELASLVPPVNGDRYWFGLRRADGEELTMWGDGSPITFFPWVPLHPNNDPRFEACAFVRNNGCPPFTSLPPSTLVKTRCFQPGTTTSATRAGSKGSFAKSHNWLTVVISLESSVSA